MRIKAIACDVDGTLTDTLWKISSEAVESIKRAENMGIPVILATARTSAFIKELFEDFDFKTSGPIIAENGGIVVNQKTGEEVMIGNPEKVKEASRVIMEEARGLVEMPSKNRKDKTARLTDVMVIGRMEAIKLIQKIALNHNLGVDLTYAPVLADIEKGIERSKMRYIIFIKDPKANKGNGLTLATEMLGIERAEVAAIGDAENDLSMFRAAGYCIAVSNADQALKSVANLVTEGSYGKGAKEAIDFVINKLI